MTRKSVAAIHSILTLLLIVGGCGTTERTLPRDDAGTDAIDTTDGDTDADTDADTGSRECEGPDPSQTCLDTGCPAGQACEPAPDGCVPSTCRCEDGEWMCTADCGQDYTCVPEAEGCPSELPAFDGACSDEGLHCEYGMECCCGECFASEFCTCHDGGWACGATDACFIDSCEGRPCDSDADCEGGSARLECESGVCIVSTPGDGWSTGPSVPIATACDDRVSDPLTLDAARIEHDELVLSVSFSGGCETHRFRACWDGAFMESLPAQARIDVQHDANGDPCEAALAEELRIPLTTMRETYIDAYGEGPATIILHVLGTTLEFEFDACTGEELPPCPPPCPEDGFTRCGEACDTETAEACGNEIGDGMACEDGMWMCSVHPPLGTGCNLVCRR